MTITLPGLPYAYDALVPNISAETVETHYEKHHKAYVEKANELAQGTRFEGMPLEEVIRASSGPLFNNAAQVWNHTFYWNSMSPAGGGEPPAEVRRMLERSFGSVDEFKHEFADAATSLFGSGYAWLVRKADGALAIEKKSDAENPLASGALPLLTIDVWEHAYYLDHKNERAKYVEAFFEILNWPFVAHNLALLSTSARA